jgi:glutamate synthase domain-containing protein 2
VKITGLSGQSNIAVGLSTEKQLSFDGTAGDFFGALNNGAIITLKGTANRFLGDTMNSGGIIVQGNTQRGVGLAMTGGIIVVRGNVNGDIGQLVRGGTIIVSGNCGPRSGAYMFKGELIVGGNLGRDAGLNMIGGTIFIGGKCASLGTNAQIRDITQNDEKKLKKYFEHYGITKEPSLFKKIMPVDNSPWKDKLLNFDSTIEVSDTAGKFSESFSPSKGWPEKDIFEILNRTQDDLLSTSGPIFPVFDRSKCISTYFDRISILPQQTTPIKSIKLQDDEIDTTVVFGQNHVSPLELKVPFIITSRGSGMVSKSCKMAQLFAAAKLEAVCDIQDGLYPEELVLNSKHNGNIICQWTPNRFGINIESISNANAIEIVLGTGGAGSLHTIISSAKITPELSELWQIPSGIDILLPPKTFDMDVPADLKRHVELIKELTEQKVPILIRLAAGNVYEDTRLAIRAGADAIVLDGAEGANQNLPTITANNVGLDSLAGIPPALKALKDTRADKRGIKIIVSGKFRNGADVYKALSLGANAVSFGNTSEMIFGCILCGKCNANICPAGIATTDPNLEIKLDWVDAGQKLTNFLFNVHSELKLLMMLTGLRKLSEFSAENIRALDYDTAAVLGIPLEGFDKKLPMWEH